MVVRLYHFLDAARKRSLRGSLRFLLDCWVAELLILAALTSCTILDHVARSSTGLARHLIICLHWWVLFLLDLVHRLQVVLGLVSSRCNSSPILTFSLAWVSLPVYLCFWSLMKVILLRLLSIQNLGVALILESWGVMTSLLRLYHLTVFSLFNPNLVVEYHRIYLIYGIYILVFNIVIWCSDDSALAIFFPGVVCEDIFVHEEIYVSTEVFLGNFVQFIVLCVFWD